MAKVIRWYENGNKWFEAKYQNGKLHGKYIGWYKNGNKWFENEYQNGRLNGSKMNTKMGD
jgi:antitoxin component YwqK of YwqJK toxin-antitoxin module